jgi:hypothetical protein
MSAWPPDATRRLQHVLDRLPPLDGIVPATHRGGSATEVVALPEVNCQPIFGLKDDARPCRRHPGDGCDCWAAGDGEAQVVTFSSADRRGGTVG